MMGLFYLPKCRKNELEECLVLETRGLWVQFPPSVQIPQWWSGRHIGLKPRSSRVRIPPGAQMEVKSARADSLC